MEEEVIAAENKGNIEDVSLNTIEKVSENDVPSASMDSEESALESDKSLSSQPNLNEQEPSGIPQKQAEANPSVDCSQIEGTKPDETTGESVPKSKSQALLDESVTSGENLVEKTSSEVQAKEMEVTESMEADESSLKDKNAEDDAATSSVNEENSVASDDLTSHAMPLEECETVESENVFGESTSENNDTHLEASENSMEVANAETEGDEVHEVMSDPIFTTDNATEAPDNVIEVPDNETEVSDGVIEVLDSATNASESLGPKNETGNVEPAKSLQTIKIVSHMAQVLNDKLNMPQDNLFPMPSTQALQTENIFTDDREIYVEICDYEAKNTCYICQKFRVTKYNFIFRPAETRDVRRYLCTDECLQRLKEIATTVTVKTYFERFPVQPLVDSSYKYARKCKQCGKKIRGLTGIYSWEAMDFCKENCLYRFQSHFTKKCSECSNPVAYSQLGKYSVRFGSIIRQFCSSSCLETKKKKIKICSYCQKSIMRTRTIDGTKCFCDEICKRMYAGLQKCVRQPFILNPQNTCCFVCNLKNEITIDFDYHGTSYYFCSNNCFILFKFVQNCDTPVKKCHTCSKFTLQQYLEKNALFYDNLLHYFCSSTCQHIYVITHRRVIPCVWCKVKKYNFDMIQKNSFLTTTIYVCSLYCLNQLKVSVDSLISKRKVCYSCGESDGVYDISLADGTTKSFCSNECIGNFQNIIPSMVGRPKRNRTKLPEKPGPLPVITSVLSLATNDDSLRHQTSLRQLLVFQEPQLPEKANVMCLVKPICSDQETEMEREVSHNESQTDFHTGPKLKVILVPIYVPQPLDMWSVPIPRPLPFPLPIPIPFLVPLTRSSAEEFFRDIKKDNTVKAPSDPFEADLLMMAELIAAEKKEEESSEIEPEIDAAEDFSPEPADSSFGDDMLRMALNLATDLPPEAAVDLEGALTANTITPSQQQQQQTDHLELMDSRQILAPGRGSRGRRRSSKPSSRSSPRGRGRGRVSTSEIIMPSPEAEVPQVPQEPLEKPDANMCLKYTFGVKAWKQWVTNKNADLERSSRRLKLFNTELLQLAADELNYSLCLFVNEVRKPNGAEYAPDTIYYLCLGIQQYLYENGRIDNIFCDSFYDKFTDTLDEVCKKFSNLYSDSYFIVTRVEEEHLWESRQLGAHSPHVLLSTLMFFNTKHFNLTTVEEHMQLSFSHIMKHWKRNPGQTGPGPKQGGSRNVLLRFYPPQTPGVVSRKRKVYEQQENEQNPLRCPVKLYEFYMSKCPESVKSRNDVFYLLPERSCVPDSPVWYSTMALDTNALAKMLHRVKMVKEINVALLTQ